MKAVIKLPITHQDGELKGQPLTVPFRKMDLKLSLPGRTLFGFQKRVVVVKERDNILSIQHVLSFRGHMKFNIPSNVNLELGNPNYTLEIGT